MTDDALRGLEQATVRRPDDPQAWAALAHAHARLGREEESMRAAVRALRLDPASEVRDLLLPMSAPRPGRPELINAVPWRGSRFGEARSVADAKPAAEFALVDLGGGLVGYHTADGEVLAIDVFAARVVWRRAGWRFHVVRGATWIMGGGSTSALRVDPATGEPVSPVLQAPTGSHLCLLDATLAAVVEQRRDEPASVSFVDPSTGRTLQRFQVPGTRTLPPYLRRSRDVILMIDFVNLEGPEIACLRPDGTVRWRLPGRFSGTVGGRALISGPVDCQLLAIDVETGEEVASLPVNGEGSIDCASEELLILQTIEVLTVLERETYRDLWAGKDDGYALFAAATADAVLLIKNGIDHLELVAHAPRTADVLDRCVVGPPSRGGAHLVPVAGHLVVADAGTSPMIVELLP